MPSPYLNLLSLLLLLGNTAALPTSSNSDTPPKDTNPVSLPFPNFSPLFPPCCDSGLPKQTQKIHLVHQLLTTAPNVTGTSYFPALANFPYPEEDEGGDDKEKDDKKKQKQVKLWSWNFAAIQLNSSVANGDEKIKATQFALATWLDAPGLWPEEWDEELWVEEEDKKQEEEKEKEDKRKEEKAKEEEKKKKEDEERKKKEKEENEKEKEKDKDESEKEKEEKEKAEKEKEEKEKEEKEKEEKDKEEKDKEIDKRADESDDEKREREKKEQEEKEKKEKEEKEKKEKEDEEEKKRKEEAEKGRKKLQEILKPVDWAKEIELCGVHIAWLYPPQAKENTKFGFNSTIPNPSFSQGDDEPTTTTGTTTATDTDTKTKTTTSVTSTATSLVPTFTAIPSYTPYGNCENVFTSPACVEKLTTLIRKIYTSSNNSCSALSELTFPPECLPEKPSGTLLAQPFLLQPGQSGKLSFQQKYFLPSAGRAEGVILGKSNDTDNASLDSVWAGVVNEVRPFVLIGKRKGNKADLEKKGIEEVSVSLACVKGGKIEEGSRKVVIGSGDNGNPEKGGDTVDSGLEDSIVDELRKAKKEQKEKEEQDKSSAVKLGMAGTKGFLMAAVTGTVAAVMVGLI